MKRLLLVEDDPTWTALLTRYAARDGWSVAAARSPQQAMDLLDEQPCDAILLDMLLAAETGMALLNELRGYDDTARLPVIVCTNVDGLTLEQLAPFGVRSLLSKATLTPHDVSYALREAADARE